LFVIFSASGNRTRRQIKIREGKRKKDGEKNGMKEKEQK